MAFVVFVTHSVAEEDGPILDELERRVQPTGIKMYVAERDVQPGKPLSTKIRNAIARADVVLALLTRNGVSSAWVNQEIGVAKQLNKRIVPLLEEGVRPPGMIVEMEYVRFARARSSEVLEALTSFFERAKKDKEFWIAIVLVVGVVALVLFLLFLLYLATRWGRGNAIASGGSSSAT